jgi:hypothetical protein
MPCASEMRWFTTALFQRPSLPVQAGRAAATGWASAPEAAVFSLKGIKLKGYSSQLAASSPQSCVP